MQDPCPIQSYSELRSHSSIFMTNVLYTRPGWYESIQRLHAPISVGYLNSSAERPFDRVMSFH